MPATHDRAALLTEMLTALREARRILRPPVEGCRRCESARGDYRCPRCNNTGEIAYPERRRIHDLVDATIDSAAREVEAAATYTPAAYQLAADVDAEAAGLELVDAAAAAVRWFIGKTEPSHRECEIAGALDEAIERYLATHRADVAPVQEGA